MERLQPLSGHHLLLIKIIQRYFGLTATSTPEPLLWLFTQVYYHALCIGHLLKRIPVLSADPIKSGRVNLYYGVGKQEFLHKKLDPFLRRENLELKFKERREKQQTVTPEPKSIQQPVRESVPKRAPQTSETTRPSVVLKPQEQPKPIVIPPLP